MLQSESERRARSKIAKIDGRKRMARNAVEVEQAKRKLFHKMMSLIPQDKEDEAIQIWAEVTFEQYWAGWEQGFQSGFDSGLAWPGKTK